MRHKHRPVRRSPHDITYAAIEELASDDAACLVFFEALRFPGGLVCAGCRANEARGAHFTRHRSRPGLFTCGSCRRQFSITSGTAMHRTKLPLSQWLRAIWLIAASSKGISARKLSEMLGLTYKVAWHLCHRIRAMMVAGDVVLSGTVEIDEIFAGAPPKRPHGGGVSGAPAGRGSRRPLVLTMVERGNRLRRGRVALERIASHSTQAIGAVAGPRLDQDAVVITDALPAYNRVNGHLFTSLRHARQLIEAWRDDYNHHRPHTSLDGLTPREFHNRSVKDQTLNRTNF